MKIRIEYKSQSFPALLPLCRCSQRRANGQRGLPNSSVLLIILLTSYNSTCLIDTLGGKASTVENLLDMSEPA